MVRKSSSFKKYRQVDTRTPIDTLSSVLISAFYQKYMLFAVEMHGLDKNNIYIYDIINGSLKTNFALDKGLICQFLTWGIQQEHIKKAHLKKRRINDEDMCHYEKVILCLCLSNGEIFLFSIGLNKVFIKLVGGHTQSVTGFVFSDDFKIGWSCGMDGKIVEWDILASKILKTFSFESSDALTAILYYNSKIICASHNIYLLNLPLSDISQTFSAHVTSIHSLIVCSDTNTSTYLFSASKDDRYINMFLLNEKVENIGVLVSESNVKNLLFSKFLDKAVLAVLTESGTKKSFTQQPTSKIIALDASNLTQDDNIIIAMVNGITSIFETVSYLDDKGNIKEGEIQVLFKKSSLLQMHVNGVSKSDTKSYNEANTVVLNGDDMADLDNEKEISHSPANIHSEKKAIEADDELTLAERLEALEMKSLQLPETLAGIPSANSLISVLVQALQLNDKTLFESCLDCQDSEIVLETVKRLEPSLAVVLLERIAERLSKRPTKVGSLNIWIRWAIIVHGGYLVTLPNLMKTLSSLQLTLLRRASALPRLLALHGRLDMLNAQIKLRRECSFENEEQEPVNEYIEEEDDDSDEEMLTVDDTMHIKAPGDEEENFDELKASDYEALDDHDLDNSDVSLDELSSEDILEEEEEEDDDDDDNDDDDSELDFSKSSSENDSKPMIKKEHEKKMEKHK
ncbi:hypothetical protein PCANB_002175 [Pneumocystis canis]|nr:hypothetical protein PCANB_002175 [Pneumocystis canis]